MTQRDLAAIMDVSQNVSRFERADDLRGPRLPLEICAVFDNDDVQLLS